MAKAKQRKPLAEFEAWLSQDDNGNYERCFECREYYFWANKDDAANSGKPIRVKVTVHAAPKRGKGE